MIAEVNVREADVKKEEVFAAYQELLDKLRATKKATITKLDEKFEVFKADDRPKAVEEKTNIEDIHKVTDVKVEVKNITRESPDKFSKYFADIQKFMTDLEARCAQEKERLRNMDLQRYLAELETKIATEQDKLFKAQHTAEATKQDAELCRKELEELYNIRVNADSLAALLQAQKEKSSEFEEEMRKRRQAFENEMVQRRRDWQMEEQEYLYQRDIARQKDRNEYEEAKHNFEQLERELKLKHEQLERELVLGYEQRERELKFNLEQRERELTLKCEYEAKLAERALNAERVLMKQEMDAERATLKQTITALEAKVAHLESLKYSFNKLSFNAKLDPNE